MTKRILQIVLFSSAVLLPALEANWVTYEGAEVEIFRYAGYQEERTKYLGGLYYSTDPNGDFSSLGGEEESVLEIIFRSILLKKMGFPQLYAYTFTYNFLPERGLGYYFVFIDNEAEVFPSVTTDLVEVKAPPVVWDPELIHVSFQSDQVSPTYFEGTWMGWLAIFADVDNGWAYAGNLREWFYTRSTDASSVPFYTQSRGWQWTSETAFSYAYQFSTDEWVELELYD